jgi:hypothetical protein
VHDNALNVNVAAHKPGTALCDEESRIFALLVCSPRTGFLGQQSLRLMVAGSSFARRLRSGLRRFLERSQRGCGGFANRDGILGTLLLRGRRRACGLRWTH